MVNLAGFFPEQGSGIGIHQHGIGAGNHGFLMAGGAGTTGTVGQQHVVGIHDNQIRFHRSRQIRDTLMKSPKMHCLAVVINAHEVFHAQCQH